MRLAFLESAAQTLLMEGDDEGLRRLVSVLRGLEHSEERVAIERLPFVQAFGNLRIVAQRGVRDRIARPSIGEFRWESSAEGWVEAAEKIGALLEAESGHQYFETASDTAVIQVSRGEYGTEWWNRRPQLNEMEALALGMLLDGDDERLAVLRAQVARAVVTDRSFTGVGFFTTLAVPADVPRLEESTRNPIDDVHAEITGLDYGAGFQVFLADGAIHTLECWIVDKSWPENAKIRRAYYLRPTGPGNAKVIESSERDLEWALRKSPR